MWFLIKSSVTFAMVLVALSYFSSRPAADAGATSGIEVQDAVSAAAQAYQYLSAICVEKPDVCEKGAETFAALGQRATEGARVAFELLDKQFAEDAPAVAQVADPQPMPEKPLTTASTAIDQPPAATASTAGGIPLPQKRPAQP